MRISDWSSDVCSSDLVDQDLNPVPNGTVGRLAVKGPTGCRYLDDERQKVFVQKGWNLPGDTFRMDDDGYLFYQARNDDMIISAGYNIAGPEVEGALLQHEAVSERSEEHTSELQSLMRISYAVFCLKQKQRSKPS